jgi:hypothetical protein
LSSKGKNMNGMKRCLLVGLTAGAALLAVQGAAGAAAPRIFTTDVDVSFPDSYFTQLCGIDVQFFNVGTFNSKLFVDGSGTVIQEIDTYPGDRVGWTSPDTGRSIEFPSPAALITTYPSGTSVSSPATVTGTGLSGKVPGLPADAGRAVFAGHVAAIDSDGVPIVVFDQLLSINGHLNDQATFETAVCAALSP